MSDKKIIASKLTNKKGGNAMFSETDLLFFNEFSKNDTTEVPPDVANRYREYREKKQVDDVKNTKIEIAKNRKKDPVASLTTVSALSPIAANPNRDTLKQNVPIYTSSSSVSQLVTQDSKGANISTQKMKRRTRKVFVDSIFRDKVLYPDPSSFKTTWGRSFDNVVQLKLNSLEFPNVTQAVSLANNKLYWINLEDADLEPPYGPFPIYSATVRPGSYNLSSLQTEMVKQMNIVKRHAGQAALGGNLTLAQGLNNQIEFQDVSGLVIYGSTNFSVDIRVIVQNVNALLNTNTVYRVSGSYDIVLAVWTITQTLASGPDTGFIFTINSGGQIQYTSPNIQSWVSTQFQFYPKGTLSVYHYIIVDINTQTDYVGFTSIIAQNTPNNPFTTLSGSGTVTLKQPAHGYKDGERVHIIGALGIIGGLQASVFNNAFNIRKISDDLFQFEITSVATTSTTGGGTLVKTGRESKFQFLFGNYNDTIADIIGFRVENSSEEIPIESPITTFTTSIVGVIPGSEFTQIISPNHKLQQGDYVYLNNFHVSPSVYQSETHKGIFEVYTVPSPDVFTINYSTERVSDITNAFVGTRLFEMYYPNHGFNRIVEIEQLAANTVKITTLFDHGFSAPDNLKTRIQNSNCIPSIDGYYTVTVIDSDSFTIKNPEYLSPLQITTSGFKGILLSDHIFYLYNVTPFGGFSSTDLNSSPFTIRDIKDADNFTFSGEYGFSNILERGGGIGIRINSKRHGWAGVQDNSPGGVLNKPVKLGGDNYAYMCIPGLNSDSISSNGPVKDIFAKIFITTNPGVIIFNEFDAEALDFLKPISKLEELQFMIKSPNDYLLSFNGLDYSFGLEVTELVPDNENSV